MVKKAVSLRASKVASAALVLTVSATAAALTSGPVAVAARSDTPVAGSSFTSASWGDAIADAIAKATTGKNAPAADPGSLYTVENAIGARTVWARQDAAGRQITGQGVTVALLDSGTASVSGLSSAGKLTYGPDLSVEGNGVLTDQDTFGHGTFMAGLIAARDPATLTAATIPKLNPSIQLGVAPDAGLLSLKMADTDGSSDASQIIAGLNWVTEHQTAADGSQVRVVNLSFGTDSIQPYQLDPLAAAATRFRRERGPERRQAHRPRDGPLRHRRRRIRQQRERAGLVQDDGRPVQQQRHRGPARRPARARHVRSLAARAGLDRGRQQPVRAGRWGHHRPVVPRQRHQPGGRGRLRRRRFAAASRSQTDP
jgi:hypothetical protein